MEHCDTPWKIDTLHSLEEILPLLSLSDLEIADISVTKPPYFFGIHDSNMLVGVVGLELFGTVGLLRSLAVLPSHRRKGLASELVHFVQDFAKSQDIELLYLLTTTASALFLKCGYEVIDRKFAPDAIRATSQYSVLCPSSSKLMRKHIV